MNTLPVLMAVCDMSPEELGMALLQKPLQALPTALINNIMGALEVELCNRLAQENGYTEEPA